MWIDGFIDKCEYKNENKNECTATLFKFMSFCPFWLKTEEENTLWNGTETI